MNVGSNPTLGTHMKNRKVFGIRIMDKQTIKKREKIRSRIAQLEMDMQLSLQKKSQGPAFDVPKCLAEIADLKKQMEALK